MFFLTVLTEREGFAHTQIKYNSFSQKDRYYLLKSFENSGFEKIFLKKIFFDARFKKITAVVAKNVVNIENPRNYAGFFSPYSLKLAHRFSRKWRTILKRAARKFKVDKEILVAILLIETGLGNVKGNYPIISVFSTILLENNKNNNQGLQQKKITKEEYNRQKILQEKIKWAKSELHALLKILEQSKQNPFLLKGSFAGAFGIPQFLPSSYLKWGFDSDSNGSVNLYLFPDAIYSAANYLKSHGWKKGLYQQSNKDVLWQYNHSNVYVDAVLEVARRLSRYQPRLTKVDKSDGKSKASGKRKQYPKKSS